MFNWGRMTQGECWSVFIGIAPSTLAKAGQYGRPRCQGGVFITLSPACTMGKAGLFQTDSVCLDEPGAVHMTPLGIPAAPQLAVRSDELVVCTCAESTQHSPF